MTENELAAVAVDICYNVHRELGPGLLESVYEAAFCHELELRKINYCRQTACPVFYKGAKMQDIGFRTDIRIENKLIVEIKSVESIDKSHHKTLLSYMKLAGVKLGILVNFNVYYIKDGLHRKILGQLA